MSLSNRREARGEWQEAEGSKASSPLAPSRSPLAWLLVGDDAGAGRLVIVGPQTQDFDGFLLFEDLVDEPVLDGNSPRVGAG